MATPRICQACREQEHDCCLNMLYMDSKCPCTHRRWPAPLCQVRGRESASTTALYFCDRPRHHKGSHRGATWAAPQPVAGDPVLSQPAKGTAFLWGKRPRPLVWGHVRAVPPPGRFDPYDPTAPRPFDGARSLEP